MPSEEYSNADSHHTFSLQGSISWCPGPQGLTLLLERSISICYLYPESTSPSLGLGRGAGRTNSGSSGGSSARSKEGAAGASGEEL